MSEHGEKNKTKWYRVSSKLSKKQSKEEIDTINILPNTIRHSIPSNTSKKDSEFKPNDLYRFKNIPFKLRLNRKFSSLDDIHLSSASQRRQNTKDNSIVLFIRSILPDLRRMNPQQGHQFRIRTLNAIGDILYKSQKTPFDTGSTTVTSPKQVMRTTSQVKFKTKRYQESTNSLKDRCDRTECQLGSQSEFSSAEQLSD